VKIPSRILGLAVLISAVCIPVSEAEDCIALPPGLVGWWSGDAPSHDLSGNYNFGNISGVSYGPGKVGSAFEFSGTGYVKVAPSVSLNVRSLTLAAWINPANESYMPIFQFQEDGEYMGALLWAGQPPGGAKGTLYSNLRESHLNNAVIDAPGVITTNQWTFVAVTYDQASGIQRLYVNGEIVKEANIGS